MITFLKRKGLIFSKYQIVVGINGNLLATQVFDVEHISPELHGGVFDSWLHSPSVDNPKIVITIKS